MTIETTTERRKLQLTVLRSQYNPSRRRPYNSPFVIYRRAVRGPTTPSRTTRFPASATFAQEPFESQQYCGGVRFHPQKRPYAHTHAQYFFRGPLRSLSPVIPRDPQMVALAHHLRGGHGWRPYSLRDVATDLAHTATRRRQESPAARRWRNHAGWSPERTNTHLWPIARRSFGDDRKHRRRAAARSRRSCSGGIASQADAEACLGACLGGRRTPGRNEIATFELAWRNVATRRVSCQVEGRAWDVLHNWSQQSDRPHSHF